MHPDHQKYAKELQNTRPSTSSATESAHRQATACSCGSRPEELCHDFCEVRNVLALADALRHVLEERDAEMRDLRRGRGVS